MGVYRFKRIFRGNFRKKRRPSFYAGFETSAERYYSKRGSIRVRRSYRLFVEDIRDSVEKIERYIKGLSYEEFIENEIVIDAVIRNLEVIGEASTNIPEDIREKYSVIPWKRMIGLRNIMIHGYFGVDLGIIWEIITRNLPETKPLIMKILEEIK